MYPFSIFCSLLFFFFSQLYKRLRAEFYYASMLFCKTVVIIFDIGWKNSLWCKGEWCLFLKHSNTLFNNASNNEKEENAYAYRLIVIYPIDIVSLDEIKLTLKQMNVNEDMLNECVMIPATINGNDSSMKEEHLIEFVNAIRINNEYMDTYLDVDRMDNRTRLEGITTIYDRYWKQKAFDVMNKHSWWDKEEIIDHTIESKTNVGMHVVEVQ